MPLEINIESLLWDGAECGTPNDLESGKCV